MSLEAKQVAPGRQLLQPLLGSQWLNTFGRLLGLVIVFAFFAVMIPKGTFVQRGNVERIMIQSAVVAAAALGATMVIISAGIDLSVGSCIALTAVIIAYVLDYKYIGPDGQMVGAIDKMPLLLPWLALAAGILVSTLVGFINGLLITGLRIVPFIVTLGTLQAIRGSAKGIANEQNIYTSPTWINALMDPVAGDKDRAWMLLPPSVWLVLLAAVFAACLLRYTRLGRHIFAVGSNEQTARLCGVPVVRTKVLVYTLAGFFAGMAGLLQYAYIGMGSPTTAIGYELAVIAAVVIGGGSLMGGEGSIFGTLVGALIITVLAAGGQQMGWPKWVQEIVTGCIIVGAVALDQFRHRRITALTHG